MWCELVARLVRERRLLTPLPFALTLQPLASELTASARQSLVERLDNYVENHRPVFDQVMHELNTNMLPRIKRNALAGRVELHSANPGSCPAMCSISSVFPLTPLSPVFNDGLAIEILLDIFNERGYSASAHTLTSIVPVRVDLKTGAIRTAEKKVASFDVRFRGTDLRGSN